MMPSHALTARDHAIDCLAWHVDAPGTASSLTGRALADAIDQAAAACGIALRRSESIASIPGLGITTRVEGRFLAIGIPPLFATLDIPLPASTMRAIASIRLAGQEAILIGSWSGIAHVCAIAAPAHGSRAA